MVSGYCFVIETRNHVGRVVRSLPFETIEPAAAALTAHNDAVRNGGVPYEFGHLRLMSFADGFLSEVPTW